MGLIIVALDALGALLPALVALVKSAIGVYDAEMTSTNTDPAALANDAIGAAKAAVDLNTTFEAQLALVRATLAQQHPALSNEHVAAVGAMALTHVKK